MNKNEAAGLAEIVDAFPGRKIAVFGDIMIDRFIKGKVRRISPEAPVPVIEVSEEKSLCGGAGNVAGNVLSLGGSCEIISVIGDDRAGQELLEMLSSQKIPVKYLLSHKNQKTIEKTRIIAEHQQVARVDREIKLKYEKNLKNALLANLRESLENGTEAVILSDYGKGILVPDTIKSAVDMCNRRKIPVFVDPKTEHYQMYRNATSITPNRMEAFLGMRQHEKNDQAEIEKLGESTVRALKLKSLIITQSENGMTIFDNFGKFKTSHIPSRAREVFDVTGAGDTVISALALAFAACGDISRSAQIANHAAGIVVGKLGTATATGEELKEEIKSWIKL